MSPAAVHFHLNNLEAAAGLVKRYHYSRRMPGSIKLVGTWHLDGGLLGNYGDAIAACIFSSPPTRWTEEVLELTRLVRHEDECPSLSKLISLCCKELKQQAVGLVVSYADFTQNHHGGIYQASSWNFDGKRDRACDGVLVNGDFVAGRSCFALWGTRSPEKLKELLPNYIVEPHYDEGKFLYWRALTKEGEQKAINLGLRSLPYYKPKTGEIADNQRQQKTTTLNKQKKNRKESGLFDFIEGLN